MDLTETTKQMVPVQMLVVYQVPGNDTDAYIERCKILCDNGKFVPGAMQPLEADHIGQLAKALNKKKQQVNYIGGVVPKQLHFFDGNEGNPTMLWVQPSKKYKLIWAKGTGLTDGEVKMPAMIYHLHNGDLNIWCVKDKVIKPNTRLYRLPLPNTYENGSICWGNTKRPVNRHNTIVEEMIVWEGRFWNSEFAHLDSGPLKKLWLQVMKCKLFPVAKLQASSVKTFKEVIKGLPAISI